MAYEGAEPDGSQRQPLTGDTVLFRHIASSEHNNGRITSQAFIKKIAKLLPVSVILSKPSVTLSKLSVILSKAKNLALGGETLRFAQGDKGNCEISSFPRHRVDAAARV